MSPSQRKNQGAQEKDMKKEERKHENKETKKPTNTYTSPRHVSYETGVLFLSDTISMSISLHSDKVS
jgi:hypothetical protein